MIAFDCRLARDRFTLDAVFESGDGITALFGPSGSGKSTVIRLIAGLEQPERGCIVLGDTVLLDTAARRRVPPHQRRIGLVFQDAQLFPHLSVRQNLDYGRSFTPAVRRRIERDPVVEVLGIGHLMGQMPSTLSGGERQRVAIGRAMLTSPALLVMDEPLASLDASRKLEILPFIERLGAEFAIPILYVSHAVEEVARLAQRVVRIEAGRVLAVGPPDAVLAPRGVGRSIERFDVVSTLTTTPDRYDPAYGVTLLSHPAGTIVVPGRVDAGGRTVRLAIHATTVSLTVGRPGQMSIRTALQGRITAVETDESPFALVTIELLGGERLLAYVTRMAVEELGLDAGDQVHALLKAVAIDERGVSDFRVLARGT